MPMQVWMIAFGIAFEKKTIVVVELQLGLDFGRLVGLRWGRVKGRRQESLL
jgi:hypothetical protein